MAGGAGQEAHRPPARSRSEKVRRYTRAAEASGLGREDGVEALTEERLAIVVAALNAAIERERGPSWSRCLEGRSRIEGWLRDGLRLTKMRKLLIRQRIDVPYSTVHRFAVTELGFGRSATTIAVLDGEPGNELQLDTGWVGSLAPDLTGRRRRFRAWTVTAVRSRHRFVYPCFQETSGTGDATGGGRAGGPRRSFELQTNPTD